MICLVIVRIKMIDYDENRNWGEEQAKKGKGDGSHEEFKEKEVYRAGHKDHAIKRVANPKDKKREKDTESGETNSGEKQEVPCYAMAVLVQLHSNPRQATGIREYLADCLLAPSLKTRRRQKCPQLIRPFRQIFSQTRCPRARKYSFAT